MDVELILLVADEMFAEMLGSALQRRAKPVAVAPNLGVGLLGLGEAGAPAGAIVMHERALREYDAPILAGLFSMAPRPYLVLLATEEPQWSVWDIVVNAGAKSANIAGDLIGALSTAEPVAPSSGFISVRMGDPWPMIRCSRCGGSRHYFKPRSEQEELGIRAQLPKFVLQHRMCLQ